LSEDARFILKQVIAGMDVGAALMANHDDQAVALLLAQPDAVAKTMKLLDVRVDFDYRRQGLGSALVYQIVQTGREQGLRAIVAETRANNLPANQFFAKCGFELAGLDGKRHSNHDLVQESATLFWYAALD